MFSHFVKQTAIFNMEFGFGVFNSIWEHTLNVFVTFSVVVVVVVVVSRRRRRRRPLSVLFATRAAATSRFTIAGWPGTAVSACPDVSNCPSAAQKICIPVLSLDRPARREGQSAQLTPINLRT